MRIDRLIPAVVSDPTNLQNYDDIAVAFDRLGQDEMAVIWMDRKRKVLDKLGNQAPSYHWYSYHANLGTVLFHDWMHKGASIRSVEEARAGRDHIAKAIRIKPDAHFGREPVQLAAMDRIIAVVGGTEKPTESGALAVDGLKKKEIVNGWAGLIVLGGAWESPDAFAELAKSGWLIVKSKTTFYLAELRARELFRQGRKAIWTDRSSFLHLTFDSLEEREFQALRANADSYVKHRQDFMLVRLRQGRHPDTDPDFWNGYQPVPHYEPPWLQDEFEHLVRSQKFVNGILFAVMILLGVGGLVVRDKVNKRRATHAGI